MKWVTPGSSKLVLAMVLAAGVVAVSVLTCGKDGRPTGPQSTSPALERDTDRRGEGQGAQPSRLKFFQLDINFDGDRHRRSQWGRVQVEFLGAEPVLYFNLVVRPERKRAGLEEGGAWVIRNMPVLSRDGSNVWQLTSFNFDLGVAEGTKVQRLVYAYELAPFTLSEMPKGAALARVRDFDYAIFSGTSGRGSPFRRPPVP